MTSFGGRSRSADVLFDQHPVSGTNIADLDLELFRSTYLHAAVDPDVLAENERTLAQQLASLGMIDPKSEEARVLGLLVVGADPSSVVPGFYVQFVRYEGSDESSHVVDQEELRGNLIGQLDVLGRLLTSNIRTSVEEVGGLRQESRPDYPLAALRELVLNALTHRDYEHFNAPVRLVWFDDRIEVSSPGGPFGVVTKQMLSARWPEDGGLGLGQFG